MQFKAIILATCVSQLVAAMPAANVTGDMEPRAAQAAQAATSHNCGGQWGSTTIDAFSIAIKDYDMNDPVNNACSPAGGCSAIYKKCNITPKGNVRFGFCNTNKQDTCVAKDVVEGRLHYIADTCSKLGASSNTAGQAFYPDGTNFIIQHCT